MLPVGESVGNPEVSWVVEGGGGWTCGHQDIAFVRSVWVVHILRWWLWPGYTWGCGEYIPHGWGCKQVAV